MKRKILTVLWLPLMLLMCGVPMVLAQPVPGARVALVVGVSEYQNVPRLANTSNDAREVALRLERFGFQVDRLYGRPISKREFDDALLRLRERGTRADAVVVYFAGHGLEINGQNYLLPSDARLLDERDVRREAVALEHVLVELRSDRPDRVNLVILDACRENLFRSRLSSDGRSVSRGLSRPDVEVYGTLIEFSTAPNRIAADNGGGSHSPYTQALLDMMDREPHLEIGLFFRRVRAQVMQRTSQQQPWEHGALVGEFYLSNPVGGPTPESRARIEDEAWALCRTGATRLPCDDYLRSWQKGRYVRLAETRIREFEATLAAEATRLPPSNPRPNVLTEPPSNAKKGRYIDSNNCLREQDGSFVVGYRSDCR